MRKNSSFLMEGILFHMPPIHSFIHWLLPSVEYDGVTIENNNGVFTRSIPVPGQHPGIARYVNMWIFLCEYDLLSGRTGLIGL
jgi:hypothetical protein